jgi:hypothetical protein
LISIKAAYVFLSILKVVLQHIVIHVTRAAIPPREDAVVTFRVCVHIVTGNVAAAGTRGSRDANHKPSRLFGESKNE